MKWLVAWTAEAESTFNSNIAYLEKDWNATVINRFIYKTEKAIALIAENPNLFPVVNKKKRIHKCLVVKQVSLYYRVFNNQIHLLTFWNNYQKPSKLRI